MIHYQDMNNRLRYRQVRGPELHNQPLADIHREMIEDMDICIGLYASHCESNQTKAAEEARQKFERIYDEHYRTFL